MIDASTYKPRTVIAVGASSSYHVLDQRSFLERTMTRLSHVTQADIIIARKRRDATHGCGNSNKSGEYVHERDIHMCRSLQKSGFPRLVASKTVKAKETGAVLVDYQAIGKGKWHRQIVKLEQHDPVIPNGGAFGEHDCKRLVFHGNAITCFTLNHDLLVDLPECCKEGDRMEVGAAGEDPLRLRPRGCYVLCELLLYSIRTVPEFVIQVAIATPSEVHDSDAP
jgi:hypothetical protein